MIPITKRRHADYHGSPAEGRCACGATVEMFGFTNSCDCCGALYNSSGQQLAPPEQWGEETGEDYRDLLRIR